MYSRMYDSDFVQHWMDSGCDLRMSVLEPMPGLASWESVVIVQTWSGERKNRTAGDRWKASMCENNKEHQIGAFGAPTRGGSNERDEAFNLLRRGVTRAQNSHDAAAFDILADSAEKLENFRRSGLNLGERYGGSRVSPGTTWRHLINHQQTSSCKDS